jgi:hypothetical protein
MTPYLGGFMKAIGVFLFFLCVHLGVSSSMAETYVWTDENGVTHFSDGTAPPPADEDVTRMESVEYGDVVTQSPDHIENDREPDKKDSPLYENTLPNEPGLVTVDKFTLSPRGKKKVSFKSNRVTTVGFKTNLGIHGARKCKNFGIRFHDRQGGNGVESPVGGSFTVDRPMYGEIELEVENLESFPIGVRVYRK